MDIVVLLSHHILPLNCSQLTAVQGSAEGITMCLCFEPCLFSGSQKWRCCSEEVTDSSPLSGDSLILPRVLLSTKCDWSPAKQRSHNCILLLHRISHVLFCHSLVLVCHAFAPIIRANHMWGGEVTVTHLLQGYFGSVHGDKVISCALLVIVHLFPLFKILIWHPGNSKTTQTSPSTASNVFLLLSLSLPFFWGVREYRSGACCSSVCQPRDNCAELSMEFSWREMPAKKAVRMKTV